MRNREQKKWMAFKRKYDRQQMRVKRWCSWQQQSPVRLVESIQEAKIAVADFLELPRCYPQPFINGAIAAVRSIEQLISNSKFTHGQTYLE